MKLLSIEFILVLFTVLFYSCQSPTGSESERKTDDHSSDSTTVPSDTSFADTSVTDTSQGDSMVVEPGDTLVPSSILGKWEVLIRNDRYLVTEGVENEYIYYYQHPIEHKWFLEITSDSLICFFNIADGTYTRRSYLIGKIDNGTIFLPEGSFIENPYYEGYGDTITFYEDSLGMHLHTLWTDPYDYDEVDILMQSYSDTLPPKEWLPVEGAVDTIVQVSLPENYTTVITFFYPHGIQFRKFAGGTVYQHIVTRWHFDETEGIRFSPLLYEESVDGQTVEKPISASNHLFEQLTPEFRTIAHNIIGFLPAAIDLSDTSLGDSAIPLQTVDATYYSQSEGSIFFGYPEDESSVSPSEVVGTWIKREGMTDSSSYSFTQNGRFLSFELSTYSSDGTYFVSRGSAFDDGNNLLLGKHQCYNPQNGTIDEGDACVDLYYRPYAVSGDTLTLMNPVTVTTEGVTKVVLSPEVYIRQ